MEQEPCLNSIRNCMSGRMKKWRNRRMQSIGGLLRSVHDLNANVYDAADELITTRNKLHESRSKLKSIIDEVEQLKGEQRNKKNALEVATEELRKAVSDLQTPKLYNLNSNEKAVLKVDLWMAEEDILEADNCINDAEDDLNIEILSNSINSKNSLNPGDEGVRNINSVSISNVISNGIISVNGNSIKINRNKCCICLVAKIDCVLYRCGHVCICFSCSRLILANNGNKKCPVCRDDIKDVIKTYFI